MHSFGPTMHFDPVGWLGGILLPHLSDTTPGPHTLSLLAPSCPTHFLSTHLVCFLCFDAPWKSISVLSPKSSTHQPCPRPHPCPNYPACFQWVLPPFPVSSSPAVMTIPSRITQHCISIKCRHNGLTFGKWLAG